MGKMRNSTKRMNKNSRAEHNNWKKSIESFKSRLDKEEESKNLKAVWGRKW